MQAAAAAVLLERDQELRAPEAQAVAALEAQAAMASQEPLTQAVVVEQAHTRRTEAVATAALAS